MNYNIVIGVDVCKDGLDYLSARRGEDWQGLAKRSVSKLANEASIISSFLSQLDRSETLFVFEPTGSYSDKLLTLLVEAGFPIALVNPRKAHYFSQTLEITTKTDAQAARMLTYMGLVLDLPLYHAPESKVKERKQLLSAIYALEKDQRRTQNRIHAMEQYHQPDTSIIARYRRILKTISKELKGLQDRLESLCDQAYKKVKKLAMTVIGIGPVTAHWLLIMTNNFTNFHSDRQLLKYCGLAPKSHQSGSSVFSKGGISKQAVSKIRASLFMAARSAIRYNKACKELYLRLRAKGKSFFKSMVAVMAKLLKQIFAVVKSNTPFDNEYYLIYQKN